MINNLSNQKQLVCIWDLDGTLGWKTPTYPAITKENVDFIKYLNTLGNVKSLIATGRPRSQARVGLKNGGMDKSDIYNTFVGGVFEDGLYVETGSEKVYNAMDKATEGFKILKNALFDKNAVEFFQKHGYVLFPQAIVTQKNSDNLIIDSYTITDYDQNFIKTFKPKDNITDNLSYNALNGILFEQGNDVRATYKAPIGFMNDDVKAQNPFFNKLEPLVRDLISKYYSNIDEHGYLVRWEDAIELYPKLGDNAFRKNFGVEMLLERIDPNKEALLVFGCDGKNDISLVDHLGSKYAGNYLVIAPKNLSSELKTKLDEHNLEYGKRCYVLNEDCTKFGVGALNILKNLKYI